MKKPFNGLDHLLGWQGLAVPLPEEWSLTAYSGDWDSGYLRAEGPNAALELKWKHDKSSPSLKKLLKDFLKQLNKAAGRKEPPAELKEKPKALSSVPQGSGVSQTFSWAKGGFYGIGAVWHCLDCRRIVLVQVTSAEPMTADSLARRIIPKIEDHPEGDTATWSVYDFSFAVPKAFRLEKQSLRSGHLSFDFKRKMHRLVAERYGPANVLLKRDRLADWATSVKPIFDLLKPYKYRKSVETVDGQEVVRLIGYRKSAKDLLMRAGFWIIRRQAPNSLDARIWKDDATNRIYLAMAEMDRASGERLTASVRESIRGASGDERADHGR